MELFEMESLDGSTISRVTKIPEFVKGRGNWNARSRSGHHQENHQVHSLKPNFAARYTLGTWVQVDIEGCKWRETRDSNESFLYPLLCISPGKLYVFSFSCAVLTGQVSFPNGKVWSMQRAEVEGKRSIHVCTGGIVICRVYLVSFVFIRGIIQDHGRIGKKIVWTSLNFFLK